MTADDEGSEGPASRGRVFGEAALGCVLLLLLHAASFAFVFVFGLAYGALTGDHGIERLGLGLYAMVFPMIGSGYGAALAFVALGAGRKGMALGIAAGTALTFVAAGSCAAWFAWQVSTQPHW